MTDFKDFEHKFKDFTRFINRDDGIFNEIAKNHNDTVKRVFENIMNERGFMEEVEKAHSELKSDIRGICNLFSTILRRLSMVSNFAQQIRTQLDNIERWIEKEELKISRAGADIPREDVINSPEDFYRYQQRRRCYIYKDGIQLKSSI